MEKVVREFDEEKLQNCKEDIDTLLVFAGLFSATLTAFLVESYQRLSEDTAGETLQAIRQLTAQTASYHIIGGLLNATVYAPTTPAPFQPLAADIRVNVLWFASLLFSLITASFGILVKQWLREYLAVDNPAPQARLRVRHLRYPQLARWKVFEIAAVLPILLQISLGLFFVGMCYFTASVHPSVRNTTLPLVAGWAFCFAAVTLLPVFFPLCPYRTTFLKRIITAFHSYIVRHATRIEFPPGYFRLVSLWRRRYLHWWACIGAALTDSNEANATSRADHDTDILIAVDTILSNDELLKTTLAEALQQSHPRASHMLSFIRSILYNRLQPSIDVVTADSFPVPLVDLQPLGLQARSAISSILCQYLASRVTAVLCWDVLAQIIFSAMLSSLGQPMPATVVRLLRESLPAQRGEGLPVRRRELRFEVRWLIDANGQLEEDAARLYIQSFRLILPHSPVDTNASVIRFITGTLLLHQQLSHGLDIHEDRHDYVRGLESMLASWPWRTVSNALKLEMAQFLVVNLEHLLYVLLADDPPTPQVLHEVSPCFRGSLVALFTGITSLSISSYLQIWTNDILALIMAHKTSASELVRVVAQTPPQQLLDFISAMGLLSPTLNGAFCESLPRSCIHRSHAEDSCAEHLLLLYIPHLQTSPDIFG
ncbi:hypothetical protein BC835DRAFT_1310896 [Cytidiella melzeri]|nr:hypothetical protein BC835DRAFT_1310896 [Cytidiella melzeri]